MEWIEREFLFFKYFPENCLWQISERFVEVISINPIITAKWKYLHQINSSMAAKQRYSIIPRIIGFAIQICDTMSLIRIETVSVNIKIKRENSNLTQNWKKPNSFWESKIDNFTGVKWKKLVSFNLKNVTEIARNCNEFIDFFTHDLKKFIIQSGNRTNIKILESS